MTKHILLDSTPLSALAKGYKGIAVSPIWSWVTTCTNSGYRFYVPEVIDYEVRRELLRSGKTSSFRRLDVLKSTMRYIPISTEAMLLAAKLWATSRAGGMPTSHPENLDVDVILAAQALTLAVPSAEIIVATAKVGHLARFVAADIWSNI